MEESLTVPTPWWRAEIYSSSQLVPPINMNPLSGPLGPAYVQVFPDGSTAPGWGGKQFMEKYRKRAFHARRAVAIYERHTTPFALVMRSVSMVCIDIDGKNGGFDSAAALNLPVTLAETSKSGNGYHLFYLTDDHWDVGSGFANLNDRISFRQGVDIRGVGCVYHWPTQQWNAKRPVQLPDHIRMELTKKSSDIEVRVAEITRLRDSTDPDEQEEFLIMQDTVQSKLTQPIPAGRRNNTLFAIGAEMCVAQVPGWEEQIYNRAVEVGLDDLEAEKLVKNIRRYG